MLKVKVCQDCNKPKPTSGFYKESGGKLGVRSKCKPCFSKHSNASNRENPSSFLNRSYSGMKYRVGCPPSTRNYKYYHGLKLLDKASFVKYSLKNRTFKRLHQRYVESGLKRNLCPSVDRIDSSKGYTAGNIRWLTLEKNCYLGSMENANRCKNELR